MVELESKVAAEVIRVLVRERVGAKPEPSASMGGFIEYLQVLSKEEIRAIKSARIRLLEAAQVEHSRRAYDKEKSCRFDAAELEKILKKREVM